MGKMFIDGGATPPTENPMSAPQRERERENERERYWLPHWSVLISRSGVLPRSGRVTTHRELALIRGTLLLPPPLKRSERIVARMKRKHTRCSRSSVGLRRKRGLIRYQHRWRRLFSWNGWYRLLRGQEDSLTVRPPRTEFSQSQDASGTVPVF